MKMTRRSEFNRE